MKTIGWFGLLALLSIFVCSRIAGALTQAAPGPDRSIAVPAPVALEVGGNLPAGLSEFVLLHHARNGDIPVRTAAVAATCPD